MRQRIFFIDRNRNLEIFGVQYVRDKRKFGDNGTNTLFSGND